jgi:small subunit ribosomal protein S15
MHLTTEAKTKIFATHSPRKDGKDTGAPESQIALFSERISHLTEHLKRSPKDKSTQAGLQRLVGKRRKLLSYLHKSNIERYRAIIKELGIRR